MNGNRRTNHRRLRALAAAALATTLLLAACQTTTDDRREEEEEEPPPTTGTLAVTIAGLPTDADAAVTVTGPGSFERLLTAGAVLAELTPGGYVVSAEPINVEGTEYLATVNGSPAEVTAGGNNLASVTYATTALAAPEDGDTLIAPAVLARFRGTSGPPVWLDAPIFNAAPLDVRGLSYRNDVSNPGDTTDYVAFEIVAGEAPTANLSMELNCGVYAAEPSPIRAQVLRPDGSVLRTFNCNNGEVTVSIPNTGGTLSGYMVRVAPTISGTQFYVAYELNIDAFCSLGCTYAPYAP
ncbi:MAG: hypothetical protein WDA15_03695 [Trueperaceae bacterium]